MSTKYVPVKLPEPLSRMLTREKKRLNCHAGDIIRAALARTRYSPLTADEVNSAKLPIGGDTKAHAKARKARQTQGK